MKPDRIVLQRRNVGMLDSNKKNPSDPKGSADNETRLLDRVSGSQQILGPALEQLPTRPPPGLLGNGQEKRGVKSALETVETFVRLKMRPRSRLHKFLLSTCTADTKGLRPLVMMGKKNTKKGSNIRLPPETKSEVESEGGDDGANKDVRERGWNVSHPRPALPLILDGEGDR